MTKDRGTHQRMLKTLAGIFRRIAMRQMVIHLFLASGIVALGTFVLFLLRNFFSPAVAAMLYLGTVVISATVGGRMAGITATLLSFLAFNYLFVEPYYTLTVHQPQDLLIMGVMLGVSVLFSSLMARAQSRLEEVQARERQAMQLYEFSNALTGQIDPPGIAATLAGRLAELFKATAVEVELCLPDSPGCIRVPTNESAPETQPIQQIGIRVMPLVSANRRLGEIRMWGVKDAFSPEEERLLRTFAGQSALALERAVLAASERRARVLEESDRLKTAILSSVSHELRTPLASIQAAATSLFNPSVDLEAEARSELQLLLLEETEHLTQLVGNLLNMSRLEAGALKLDREWNSLAEISASAARRLKRFTHDHDLQIHISEELPLVAVDSVLMEQVFINLLGNSLKFTPPGKSIQVSAEEVNNVVRVVVCNQGPPIPAPYLERIFEKFNPIPAQETIQRDRNPERDRNPGQGRNLGTGLGLSICKGIVEAHEGRIWAENLEDGVAFFFTLPLSFEGARPPMPERGLESEADWGSEGDT